MKEHEQNLPLLEDEGLNSPDSRQSRYSPFLSRARQTKFVVALGIYGLLMTAIVVVQNLPHAKKADPYSIYFSATEEEVKSSNEEPDDTVSLLDRDGYLGTIGVYHGLHCMRRIYWHLHEDTYFKNRTAEARAVEIVHARHCLGVVVNDLMCNADTALYTFGYYPDRDPIPRLKSGASRQCLKWDPFHQWATDRAPGYHPRLQAPVNLLRERTFEGSLQAEDMDVSSLKE
ncbi:hypothetical protein SNOG_02729 [Parastagonospora nodorum SN15]|uniref:DUF3328 domain-containing protein n=1 Tax=Phaeosphaeria nodorum (strain SN15 / ATCC MYA-4574 / FGSC 10173) TaxID=321614 RepID=Q0UZT5_PHANO|nr:hypothetical protein SNOG_02729 [Parastagonospora nodorum SN15]EAT89460.1 hypothetical protein SNOG_02729 [Parastagonospora nodorum SN15]